MVPANIEPITNAPRASEKPDFTENTAITKHKPIDITSSISSVIERETRLKNDGSTNTPTVNHITKNSTSLRTLIISYSPSTELLIATDDSNTIITTANKSSHTSTASTSDVNRR